MCFPSRPPLVGVKPWLAVEQFEYQRVRDDSAQLRLLAMLDHEVAVPVGSTLVVHNDALSSGAYAPSTSTTSCPHAVARRIDAPTGLLWQASFVVSLEVVEYPQALFTLTADGRVPVALPAPILTSVEPAQGRRGVRLRGARVVQKHLVALAAGFAIAAVPGSVAGVAVASTVTQSPSDSTALTSTVAPDSPSVTNPPTASLTNPQTTPASPPDPSTVTTTSPTTTNAATTTSPTTTSPAPTTPVPQSDTKPPPSPQPHATATPSPNVGASSPTCRPVTSDGNENHALNAGRAHQHHGHQPAWVCTPDAGPQHEAGTHHKSQTHQNHHKAQTHHEPGAALHHHKAPTRHHSSSPPHGSSDRNVTPPQVTMTPSPAPTPAIAAQPTTTVTPATTANSSDPSTIASWLGVPSSAGLAGLSAELGQSSALLAAGSQPPAFLIPIYKTAARRYHVPWQILAAINWIETDFGRNLNTSSAGAVGWMQFMPGTWQEYGVAANGNGQPNPYSPQDSIFSAAHYLAANGAAQNLPKAIFAYNHAAWYVAEVIWRAQIISDHSGASTDTSLAGTGRTGLAGAETMLVAAFSAVGGPYSQANHGSFGQTAAELRRAGTDCSGFVSWVLNQVDPGFGTQTTVTLPDQPGILPGVGQYVTMWDRPLPGNQGHVIINILGTWFESGGNSAYNPAGGISPMSEAQAVGELTGGGFLPYHLKDL